MEAKFHNSSKIKFVQLIFTDSLALKETLVSTAFR